MSKKFLIFSGHNDRAAIALCRYFTTNEIPFVVAARIDQDMIRESSYRDRIIFTRQSSKVNLDLFRDIAKAAGGEELVYCPTTEFINLFLLQHRGEIEELGYIIPLAASELYAALTHKESSAAFFDGVGGLVVPQVMTVSEARAPCVLKPRKNLMGGKILHPLICRNAQLLEDARSSLDIEAYFAQEFVYGDSLYFCSYMDRHGYVAGFWQRNLGQQVGGKSIVLAQEVTVISENMHRMQSALLSRLFEAGYEGPIMVEVRASDACNYFIEMNPRFWGPLQLAVDVCPELMEHFVKSAAPEFRLRKLSNTVRPAYYAWTRGMIDWERLGAAASVDDAYAKRETWDVFARRDYADVEHF